MPKLDTMTKTRMRNLELFFAKDTGNKIKPKDRSFISLLINGKRPTFGERAARRLEVDYGMPINYLDQENSEPICTYEQDSTHIYRVDLLDVAGRCGGEGFINEDYPAVISSLYFTPESIQETLGRCNTNGLNLINAKGDSMTPTINHGDLLFIDTNIKTFVGEGVYFFVIDGLSYIKRLQHLPGGKIMVLSDNKNYVPFEIDFAKINIHIVGKFIKVLHIKSDDL